MIWPLELFRLASLAQSPGSGGSGVITPFFQANARNVSSFSVQETPIASPLSFIHVAYPHEPPRVPRSRSVVPSQRNGCCVVFPGTFDQPTIRPCLLRPSGQLQLP